MDEWGPEYAATTEIIRLTRRRLGRKWTPGISVIKENTGLHLPVTVTEVVPKSHVFQDANGVLWAEAPVTGRVFRQGMTVTSNNDALTGVIVGFEFDHPYARVRSATGKVKVRNINHLMVRHEGAQLYFTLLLPTDDPEHSHTSDLAEALEAWRKWEAEQ